MNRLKELRQKKKLSQKEIALELQVPLRTYQRWENGESQIKQDKAQKLSDYFGVSIGILLGYRDKKDSLGFRLWSLRNQKGVELEKAAKDLRLSKEELQRLEKTDNLTLGDKLAKDFADYFGVSVGYLLGYEVIDLMDTTYLEDYIFFDGDYSDPDKTKAEYFEEISEKIKIYKKVVSSLYGRYDKSKAIEVLELLEKNREDDLDDIYKILQDKLELALFRYIAQYQLLLPEFYHLQDKSNENRNVKD